MEVQKELFPFRLAVFLGALVLNTVVLICWSWLCLLLLVAPGTSQAQSGPTLYVLTIGVGQYQDDAISHLQFVDDDVDGIQAWAETQRNAFFRQVRTQSLLDKEATRARIVQTLLSFYAEARDDDLLILYLTGHGMADDATGSWHYLPYDADVDHDGTIRLAELRLFVDGQVRALSSGQQSPQLSGWDTDAVLAALPNALELCDGVDNNFNRQVDGGFPDTNANGKADCLEQELCNGIDDNGNGVVDEGFDQDRDGHRSIAHCGTTFGDDCDDRDVSIHPDQRDWGNLRDDDCDGAMDEDDFDVAPCDGIPDRMNEGLGRYRKGFVAMLATMTALTVLEGVLANHAWQTLPSVGGEYEVGSKKESFDHYMRGTVMAGTGLLVGLGLTIHFR